MCRHEQHPRALLLTAWCGLLTVAVTIMAVLLFTGLPNQRGQGESITPLTENGRTAKQFIDPPHNITDGQQFLHIQLIFDGKSWIKDQQIHSGESTSTLDVINNSVNFNADGLYYFYARATFSPVCNKTDKKMVVLTRNAIPGRKEKTLSETVVERSMSVSKVVRCEKGDSIKLEIKPIECALWNDDKTYWGIILLPPYTS